MSTALRLFQNFEKCYLEVCVPDRHRKRFELEYALRTKGNSPKCQDGYNTRDTKKKYNAWGIEFRVYFKTTTDWLVDSLKKLGFHTEISDKLIAVEFINDHPDHGYKHRITNVEFFWWLVDYGYRLGENDSISYDLYNLRDTLKKMRDRKTELIPMVKTILIESENPIEEARMLAALA